MGARKTRNSFSPSHSRRVNPVTVRMACFMAFAEPNTTMSCLNHPLHLGSAVGAPRYIQFKLFNRIAVCIF